MTSQSYQLAVQDLNKNLKIGYTVYPQEILSEEDWNKQNKVSSCYVYPEPLFNAREMMKQYTQDETYYSKIKKIINAIY